MRKIIITIIILLLIAFGIFYFSGNLTGQATQEEPKESLYTKAICNTTEKGNIYCEDYEISCKGEEVININPTGNAVYHENNWEDPREDNLLCG